MLFNAWFRAGLLNDCFWTPIVGSCNVYTWI
jgi:hypothetical protein